MAQTTVDPEKLPDQEQNRNIDGETEKDLREETGEQPEAGPEEEPAEATSEAEKAEPEEMPKAEPEKKPEAASEEKAKAASAEIPEEERPEEIPEKTPKKPEKRSGKKAKRSKEKSGKKRKKTVKWSALIPDDEDDYDDDEDAADPDDLYDEDDDYDEDPEDDESEEGGMGLNLFTLFVLLIAAALTTAYFTCTVKTVRVTGNSLYTSEEIAEQVISDDTQLRHNTVFLTLLYMTPLAPKIPFEESVKVIPESYDTITIAVKDMNIAGFIPYAGRNLYFSSDGIVLENSPLLVKNATFVTGVSVTGAEIGTKMTSDDEVGLGMVLEVLQILRKYQISVDSVVLTRSGSIVIYMDEIKVQLGRSDFELKISKIAQIMPYLEGRSGTINMTNYTSSDQNIILK